jgi:hypothetical protein
MEESKIKVEETIPKELVKVNVTETALMEMEKFLSLEIRGLDDKEGYKAVDEARKMCKATRVLTKKVCEDQRAEYIRLQKQWIAVQNGITDRVEKVELALEEKLKVIDDEKARIRQEKDLQEQKHLQERSVILLQKYGMTYNIEKSQYELADVAVSVIEVKTCDDFTWAAVIAGIESRWKIIEDERLEQLRLKEIADAEAKRIAEENLAKLEALEKRERELKEKEDKMKADLERLEKEAEALQKAEADAKAAEARRIIEERIKTRKTALFQLGFAQQDGKLVFQEIGVSNIVLESDSLNWTEFYTEIQDKVEAVKQRMEKEREAREKKLVEEALLKQQQENEAKAKEEAAKVEAARKENARIAAMAPDIDKLKLFCKTLADLPLPEFTSDNFKIYVKSIADKRTAFLTDIFKNQPK